MGIPKISVCMPVYNGSKYIKEAIDSVLKQTFSDFEFIIVDDTSTDKTLDIIKSYKDPRIKVYKNQKHLGQVSNYNKSISYAKSEYIKPLHQDDMLDPHCLMLQMKTLDENPEIALVFNDTYLIDSKSQRLLKRILPFREGVIKERSFVKKFFFCLDFNFIGEPSTVIFKKNVFYNLGRFNEGIIFSNDIELWTRLNISYKCFYLKKSLVSVRLHGEQSVSRSKKDIKYAIFDNYLLFSALFKYSNTTKLLKILLFIECIIRIPLLMLGRGLKKMLRIPEHMLLLYYVDHKHYIHLKEKRNEA